LAGNLIFWLSPRGDDNGVGGCLLGRVWKRRRSAKLAHYLKSGKRGLKSDELQASFGSSGGACRIISAREKKGKLSVKGGHTCSRGPDLRRYR